MPDISKLPELCKILNISFEELVGEKNPETEITKRLMEDEDTEVTLEEMAQVGQLVAPEKIEEKVNETMKTEGKIPFSVLVSLAPFMDRETLEKAAEDVADVDMGKVCAIAPFLSQKTLDRIVDKSMQNGNVNIGNITAIAPFLSRDAIRKVVECCVANNQADKLTAIAPFMGRNMLSQVLQGVNLNAEETTDKVNFSSSGRRDTEELDEDDIAQLAFAAFEQGNDVSQYLDDMDEDDVAQLAFMALNAGKDIEMYLDYMDEDAIKSLLLQSVRK